MDLGLDASELDALASTPIRTVDFNASDLTVFQIGEDTEITTLTDPVYEQFLADVWVGIVLTLMVLSCVCFMCSCLIYHKFQEWKHRVVETRNAATVEAGLPEAELPSYTIASGLPTYEEALEQLRKVQNMQQDRTGVGVSSKPVSGLQDQTNAVSDGAGNTVQSVFNLFGIHNSKNGESGASKPA